MVERRKIRKDKQIGVRFTFENYNNVLQEAKTHDLSLSSFLAETVKENLTSGLYLSKITKNDYESGERKEMKASMRVTFNDYILIQSVTAQYSLKIPEMIRRIILN